MTIQQLCGWAIKAEYIYALPEMAKAFNEAADIVEDLCKQLDGTIRVAAEAIEKVRQYETLANEINPESVKSL